MGNDDSPSFISPIILPLHKTARLHFFSFNFNQIIATIDPWLVQFVFQYRPRDFIPEKRLLKITLHALSHICKPQNGLKNSPTNIK